jgi:hypothetical protein
MPFYLAQLVNVLVWGSASATALLGTNISLFKILYVTHFDMVFNQDPDQLGRIVLAVCSLTVGIPHCFFYIYYTINNIKITPVVAYYMGEPMLAESANPMQLFCAACLALDFLLMALAMILQLKTIR